jgi:hypothetical protein
MMACRDCAQRREAMLATMRAHSRRLRSLRKRPGINPVQRREGGLVLERRGERYDVLDMIEEFFKRQ